MLAPRIAPGKEEILFLGGLMHDIGKLVLVQRSPNDYAKVIEGVEREGLPFHEIEARIFPFDHTEVGQLIAERWRFTSELIEMIRLHHAPWERLHEAPLARTIRCADEIAHALALGHGKGLPRFLRRIQENLPETWRALGVASTTEQQEMLSRARQTFDREYNLYSGAPSA